ncbi:MAG TPA: NADH-quinone oxidoreductase subunit N [Ignavibacteriaceae bacterium]|nr:NADH-quinone oxidoreductase subunit N [Ignavibacteriaceae bacterium]
MSFFEIESLRPLIIIAGIPVLIMLSIAVKRNHLFTFWLSLIGLCAAFIFILRTVPLAPIQVKTIIIVDSFSLFYIGLLAASVFFVFLLSFNYINKQDHNREEFYILIFLALLGSSVMASSNHFVSLFLGLEILSVSLYGLISFIQVKDNSLEAGIKYLILASVSSAFLLFGMALIYAVYGRMDFPGLAEALKLNGITPVSLAGFALIIVGVGFKLALVPFHMWTPDIYQAASAPVSGFIATVSKGGMFAVLLRFYTELNGHQYKSLTLLFSILAIASMLTGNLLALLQNNVKRILAYSSISHFGYILVAFLAGGKMGIESSTFYLAAYFVTILGSFGIVSVLSDYDNEAELIDNYQGLFWKRPLLSIVFTAMLFSLAGIPLTAGFIGKYYVLAAGVNSSLWLLVIVLAGASVIGLYYYLRIVVSMFSQSSSLQNQSNLKFTLSGTAALGLLTVLVILFGVYPSGLIEVIQTLAKNFISY